MNFQLQTIEGGWDVLDRGDAPGDCMRAAVASIFERRLDEVPHFADGGPRRPGNELLWWYAWIGWALHQGVAVYQLEVIDPITLTLPGYSLLSGISPRAEPGTKSLRHVCVGWNGQIVWDPHPSGAGLRTIDEADLLVPITAHASALLAKAPG